MKVQKKGVRRVYSTKKIQAEDDIIEDDVDAAPEVEDGAEAEADVSVDPEATELVFEAEDVAELLAEATGQDVAVTVDTDAVVFEVGEEEFTVQPDGGEEILESSRKSLRSKKTVAASRKVAANRRPAAKKLASRPIRRK